MAYGKKSSPLKLFGSRRRKREQTQANTAFNQQMQEYQNFDVGQNIYSNFKNPYAGAVNVYEGMENMYEDLRIDTTAAELAGSQFAQSQADQLAALGASAGGSGFGALTTSLSRQAAQQSAANTADVRRQGIQREQLIAGEASRLQTQERAGAAEQQQLIMGGEEYAQTMRFQGASDALTRQLGKEQELLGMAAGRKTAADQARQANTQMWMNLGGQIASAALGNVGELGDMLT